MCSNQDYVSTRYDNGYILTYNQNLPKGAGIWGLCRTQGTLNMVFLEQGEKVNRYGQLKARKCLLVEGKTYLCGDIGRGIIRNGYLLHSVVGNVLIYWGHLDVDKVQKRRETSLSRLDQTRKGASRSILYMKYLYMKPYIRLKLSPQRRLYFFPFLRYDDFQFFLSKN